MAERVRKAPRIAPIVRMTQVIGGKEKTATSRHGQGQQDSVDALGALDGGGMVVLAQAPDQAHCDAGSDRSEDCDQFVDAEIALEGGVGEEKEQGADRADHPSCGELGMGEGRGAGPVRANRRRVREADRGPPCRGREFRPSRSPPGRGRPGREGGGCWW